VEHVAFAVGAAQRIGVTAGVKEWDLVALRLFADGEPRSRTDLPIRQITWSRSTSLFALVTAVAGLTLSSAIISILRPSTPPAALASSTASTAPL